MARESVDVAYVFHDTPANARFTATHSTVAALPHDRLSIEFEDGEDDEGPVLGVVFTRHQVVYRRPLIEDGDQ